MARQRGSMSSAPGAATLLSSVAADSLALLVVCAREMGLGERLRPSPWGQRAQLTGCENQGRLELIPSWSTWEQTWGPEKLSGWRQGNRVDSRLTNRY